VVKILLVDSSEKVRNQLSTAIKRIRFDVQISEWAEEALDLIENQDFDAVMIRNNLPGLSIVNFLAAVKQSATDKLPVIIAYGKFDIKKRLEIWRAGIDDIIEMPFVVPEVLVRLSIRLTKNTGIVQTGPVSASEDPYQTQAQPEKLPSHGSIENRPLPVCLSNLFLNRATGVIRFIEGKHIRSLYVENGYIRGAHSSRKDENFGRLILKWMDFPGDMKRHFKSMPDNTPAKDTIKTIKHFLGFQNEAVDAIVVRHMHYVVQGILHMNRGEFDWSPDETPDDMAMINFRGLHPIHLVLIVVRDTSPTPDYSSFLTNREFNLVPVESQGLLRDTYRLTAPEMCVTALTANGISLNDWLKQAEIVLPYATAFIYIMLSFRVFQSVERAELTPMEAHAVTLPAMEEKDSDKDMQVIDEDQKDPEPLEQAPDVTNKPDDKQIDQDGVTEFDIRPVKKRIMKTSKKTLLDQELNGYQKNATPHRKYKAIKERLKNISQKQASSQKQVSSPKALELYGLDNSSLASGHIWDNHPALIFKLVISSQQTGVLEFSDAACVSRFYWQNGRLVYAKSDKDSLRIDQVLFDLGIINEDQKKDAANLWEQYGGMRSGTGLFRQNIVSIMDLTDAVKEQIKMIVHDVCEMPAGDYKFIPGPLPESECIAFDVSTERILQQAIRSMEDLGNLKKIIPNLNVVLAQTPGATERAQEVHLEGIDIFVLSRFRKASAAKSGFAGMDVGLQTFKNILAGLYILDFLEIQFH